MPTTVTVRLDVHARFLQGIGRIAEFWGFPKSLGAAYAAVYLSPTPLTLDDLVTAVGISKGAVCLHMGTLERLGLVHLESRPADRKDYYYADTDFWGVARRVLRERESREFDRALRTVSECLRQIDASDRTSEDAVLLAFYRERLAAMERFFHGLDRMVAALLAIEDFRESAVRKFFGGSAKRRPRKKGSAS